MAKKLSLILMVLLIGAIVDAKNISQNTNLPFNSNQIIEQVSVNLVREKSEFNNTQKRRNKNQLPDDEFLINTSIVTVQAPYERGYPVAASDGINYLIIWIDGRNLESHGEIFGTLVDQVGRIITPAGIAISTDLSYKSNPAVAFDGLTYLVVWEDERNGEESDIYGKRIARFGSVLDTFDIPISTFQDNQENPSVAFDGINYLVVWEDQRNRYSRPDIYGARVNTSGVVLDTAGFPIVSTDYDEENPAVAFDGTNYLVIWEDDLDEDIYGFRVNPDGVIIDTTPIIISSAEEWQGSFSIAFDGTNYLIVWVDERSNQTWDIYGTLVATSGTVLDTNGFVISNAIHDQFSPTVTFANSNYFVAWLDRRNGSSYEDIYGARVNQSGIVLDTNGILIDNPICRYINTPSVSFNGINCLIVWSKEDTLDDENIVGARLNQSGIVLDPFGFLISTAANCQISPAIAFDGINYLVVWSDSRNDNDIYGTRINQFGEIVDTNGIAISTANGRQEEPSVAFDGINYLVAWTDFRSGETSHIYVARVNRDGLVLDPAGMLISSPAYIQSSPSIDFDSQNYLIVWETERQHSDRGDIYGTRMTPTGLVLDPAGIPISTSSNRQMEPSLAFDGMNYLVVWGNGGNSYDIYGARVSPSGVVIDPDGIAICTTRYEQNYPSVCYKNTNYLVVWEDEGYDDYDIYGARVNSSGVVLDTNCIAISTAEEDQEKPYVTFSDTNFFVVWQHEHNDYFDIYGAKISPSGIVIDSFPISNQEGNQYSPVCFCKIEEQMLIAYSGWTETVQSKTYNAERIWGKLYSLVGIEDKADGEMQNIKLLEIYPNPAKSVIRVCIPPTFFLPHQWGEDRRREIKIFDVSGKLIEVLDVTSAPEHKQEIIISLKGINPGVYFLGIGKEVKKFIVAR